jgi:hypothetical protein
MNEFLWHGRGIVMNEEEKYRRAKERVEEIKSFYVHVMVYIMVNIVLFIIDVVTSPGAWWFYWPLFGWGVAVFIHGFTIFGTKGLFGKSWEEKKIKEIMGKYDS